MSKKEIIQEARATSNDLNRWINTFNTFMNNPDWVVEMFDANSNHIKALSTDIEHIFEKVCRLRDLITDLEDE